MKTVSPSHYLLFTVSLFTFISNFNCSQISFQSKKIEEKNWDRVFKKMFKSKSITITWHVTIITHQSLRGGCKKKKQAPSYASPKLRPTDRVTDGGEVKSY